MKTTMILFIEILITTLVYSKPWKSVTEGKNETGIAFHQRTWDEALKLAKKASQLFPWRDAGNFSGRQNNGKEPVKRFY